MTLMSIRELGQGTFGVVELVQDENGNQWARKTLRAPSIEGLDEDHLQKRFLREVKYQSSIDHPNVVRIVESNLTVSPPYFLMEVAECTLRQELAIDRNLGGDPTKAIFDILSGIEVLHDKGISHRDLKPANILKFVSTDGSVRYAVSDFGLMTAADSESSSLTASNMQGGTPLYAAPELAHDFRRGTHLSDIYSIGAILHDIFGVKAARVPYTELTLAPPLGPIVSKSTKKLPQRRYQSIAELRSELYDVLKAGTISFSSGEEQSVVDLLRTKESLSDDEWDRIFLLIDDNKHKGAKNHNVFRAVSISHIQDIADHHPGLFSALGIEFCEFVQNGTFDFDYCDILASKVQVIHDLGQINLKAASALSLLVMGVNHNRWFVEHKFMKMVDSMITPQLAERIILEADVQGVDFKHYFNRLTRSISATSEMLHPVLAEFVDAPAKV